MKNLNNKYAELIRESIHTDVEHMVAEDIKYNDKIWPRTVMARDIILPILDNIEDPQWFIKNKGFDITRFNKLTNGVPDLTKLQREYPELK